MKIADHRILKKIAPKDMNKLQNRFLEEKARAKKAMIKQVMEKIARMRKIITMTIKLTLNPW